MADATGTGAGDGPKGLLALQTLAMPADTNANGDIFGGWLMGQMDLGRVATVHVEAMTFHRAVQVGDMVTIYADLQKEGRSSMRYGVEAWITRMPSGETAKVTEAVFIYVAIDEAGKSRPLP